VVDTVAAAEDLGPDMADTRLSELRDRREYEWERGGRGLNPRHRAGGAVLGTWKDRDRK
jgi:hypothetical protein